MGLLMEDANDDAIADGVLRELSILRTVVGLWVDQAIEEGHSDAVERLARADAVIGQLDAMAARFGGRFIGE